MHEHDTADPLARDIERIHALRDQGRLTSAEAERLIAVLRGAPADDDAARGAADGPAADGAAAEAAAAEGAAAGGDAADARVVADHGTPRGAPGRSTPHTPPAPQPADDLGVAWLTTEMLAADLVVEATPGVTEPRLRKAVEDATLTAEGDHWRLRYRSDWTNWGVFGKRGAPERIEVELPESMGVQLDVKAGDVTIRGVTHVRGRMLAGDLSIDGASFVDVDKKAGDFDARIRPTTGKQRLVAKAGDLDVILLAGSDVTIAADVTVGDLRVKGEGLRGERESRGIGHRYRGTLGAGAAELELRLSAGSLTLKTEA